MVDPALFSLFLVTSLVNIASPGMGFVLVMAVSLERGFKHAILPAIAVGLAVSTIIAVAFSGVGLVIAGSPLLFAVIKAAGAVIMLWLGVRKWRSAAKAPVLIGAAPLESSWQTAVRIYGIQLTNPQPIVFAVSVLPQFVSMDLPYIPQCAVMTATYGVCAAILGMAYALLASRARAFLAGPKGPLIIGRTIGVVFIAIGLVVLWLAARPLL